MLLQMILASELDEAEVLRLLSKLTTFHIVLYRDKLFTIMLTTTGHVAQHLHSVILFVSTK